MRLVVVESPSKAKTIGKYLGKDYKVVACLGHVRDLPSKSGSVLPEQDFVMKYEIISKSSKYIEEIAKLSKSAEEIVLATDPDREGEAISWHVTEVLKEKNVIKNDDIFKRITFNEVSKGALLTALACPRKLDKNLIDAQQARRALDYLVGFTLSPVLWRKLPGGRSAGRVQSVGLRLICDREHEIEQFVSQEYWSILIDLVGDAKKSFTARLTRIGDEKLEKFSIINETMAKSIVQKVQEARFVVESMTEKQQKRNPAMPFITSSLQQEAFRKLGFSAKKTMQIAQKLYEGIEIDNETIGLITYMRTDGVTLSEDAIASIRGVVSGLYGDQYVPEKARRYKSKSKNAQEAHEAIRPTRVELFPKNIASQLDSDQFKLYNLIWMRTVASQMESMVLNTVCVDVVSLDGTFSGRANGSIIAFDGFSRVYQEGRDDNKEEIDDEDDKMLPPLKEGEKLDTHGVESNQHFTEPPPRYSEASLVKKMEEIGIGRPSTYATIISVLRDREYVTLEKNKFVPSELGRLVTVFLARYFTQYVEYGFTATLETELDLVAAGDKSWKGLLSDFWNGFHKTAEDALQHPTSDIIKILQESLDLYLFGRTEEPGYAERKKCPSCTDGVLCLKLGKYGAFLGCGNYPTCSFRKSIGSVNDSKEGSSSSDDKEKYLGKDESGALLYLKRGAYGPYIEARDDSGAKPKRISVPSCLSPDSIDVTMAVKLVSLPKVIGNHSGTGDEILLGIGRYGPYLKYQGKFVSIPKDVGLFFDIATAEKIIASKKR